MSCARKGCELVAVGVRGKSPRCLIHLSLDDDERAISKLTAPRRPREQLEKLTALLKEAGDAVKCALVSSSSDREKASVVEVSIAKPPPPAPVGFSGNRKQLEVMFRAVFHPYVADIDDRQAMELAADIVSECEGVSKNVRRLASSFKQNRDLLTKLYSGTVKPRDVVKMSDDELLDSSVAEARELRKREASERRTFKKRIRKTNVPDDRGSPSWS